MDSVSEKFDLHTTLKAIGQAGLAVVCHMVFKFALHGLFMAVLLAVIGAILLRKSHRFGPPLLVVARRVAIVCLFLCLPGASALVLYGSLPPAGVFNINSIGFVCLWSLICLHLSAEEINHRESTT
jgi:hypothetical protein